MKSTKSLAKIPGFFLVLALAWLSYPLVWRPLDAALCKGGLNGVITKILSGRMGMPSPEYCMERSNQLFFLILAFGTASAFAIQGLLFLVRRMKGKPRRDIFLTVCFLFFLSAAVGLTAEGLMRLYQKAALGIPFSEDAGSYSDPELGWKGRAVFGDLKTAKPKIFFLGDSMTDAREVPQDQRFYKRLGRALNAEVFAYANAGYGTLQELIALRRYKDGIKPDLIVLQVHPNDFINNSWELESASFFSNKIAPRPYLIDGKVEYLFPGRHQTFSRAKFYWTSRSRLLAFVANRVDRLTVRLWQLGVASGVESRIQKEGIAFKSFQRSAETTSAIVAEMKEAASDCPILAFTADDLAPYDAEFRKIFQQASIPFFEEIPKQMRGEETRGKNLKAADGVHWNAAGHEAAGTVLAEFIRSKAPFYKS